MAEAFGAAAVGAGVVELGGVGAGGGGIVPFGGPNCMTGRSCVGGGAGGFGSLTVYRTASKTWGPTAMVTWPSLDMLSFGGLFGGSLRMPRFLTGLVQYRSKTPSPTQTCRDRCKDSLRTPLNEIRSNLVRASCDGGARDAVPLLERLKVSHGQVVGLRILHRRQRLA